IRPSAPSGTPDSKILGALSGDSVLGRSARLRRLEGENDVLPGDTGVDEIVHDRRVGPVLLHPNPSVLDAQQEGGPTDPLLLQPPDRQEGIKPGCIIEQAGYFEALRKGRTRKLLALAQQPFDDLAIPVRSIHLTTSCCLASTTSSNRCSRRAMACTASSPKTTLYASWGMAR